MPRGSCSEYVAEEGVRMLAAAVELEFEGPINDGEAGEKWGAGRGAVAMGPITTTK